MTTADDARREAAFLYWRLPKNKQPQVPQELTEGQGAVVDDSYVSIAALGVTAKMMLKNDPTGDRFMTTYTQDGKLSREELMMFNIDEDLGLFAVDREMLLKLLQPMTSDYVTLQFSGKDGVWILGGMVGDKTAAAYIAPSWRTPTGIKYQITL